MCIQVANGSHKHTGSLTPGEITVQDAEGNVISSRASFSLGLYLKQHLPHLNAVALSLHKSLHTC